MNKGFTIVELLSVIAILALIMIIVTPTYSNVNESIRAQNYNSRKNEIRTQTISFVEKYIKDKAHDANGSNHVLCFSPEFLIQNGIITSDDSKLEYIKNDLTNEKYSGNDIYIKIIFKESTYKLNGIIKGEDNFDTTVCTKQDNNIFD